MNKIVKTDILNVLDNSLVFIEKKDFVSLKDLSNHVIHNASIFQDSDSVNIAVIIYCISKIFDRDKDIDDKTIHLISEIKHNLENNRFKDYSRNIKFLYKNISRHDSKLKLYINEVISMAQAKKSTKIYDHGISLQQSAQILGISQWELMEYLGNTQVVNSFEDNKKVKERLDFAKTLFGLKT